jgi:chromosomal replication initiator protein
MHLDLPQSPPEVIRIQQIVANHYGLPIEVMTSSIRTARYVKPRQVGMILALEILRLSKVVVGRSFGGRNHGTVCHACRAVANRCATEPPFAADLARIRAECAAAFHQKSA